MKFTITLKVNADGQTPEALEMAIQDLLTRAVLPALGATLEPLTLTVKKAR